MDPARERELSEAIRDRGPRAIAAGESLDFRHDVPQPDGTVRTLRVRGDLVSRGGEGTVLQGFAQDISELARATTQQQVVAELDRVALGDAPIAGADRAGDGRRGRHARRPARGRLRARPGGRELVLRGLAPSMEQALPLALPAGEASFGGYTLRLRRPVVVDDWEAESRFSPEIGRSLGLRSGACVVVGGAEAPFGILMAVADHVGPLRRGGHRLPAEPGQRARRGRRPPARRGRDRGAGGGARAPGGAGARRRGARAAVDVREPARRRAAGHPGRRPRPVGARRRPGRRAGRAPCCATSSRACAR